MQCNYGAFKRYVLILSMFNEKRLFAEIHSYSTFLSSKTAKFEIRAMRK